MKPISSPADLTRSIRGSETILLVEDHEDVRALMAEYLSQNGYQVLQAQNGIEALQLAKQHSGSIDMLITDIVMPKMRGPELAEHLRLQRSGLKTLYVSGYAETTAPDSRSVSSDTVLQKPFPLATLGRKVRELLAKSG